jgi:hypothetical protein
MLHIRGSAESYPLPQVGAERGEALEPAVLPVLQRLNPVGAIQPID